MSTISIIGTGGMATAIGGRIAKAGHTVEVISRDPAKARALADKLAAGATTGTYGAAPAGDIVILAVPYGSAAAVVTEFGDALDGKVIIDITNPISPDLTGLVTPRQFWCAGDRQGRPRRRACREGVQHPLRPRTRSEWTPRRVHRRRRSEGQGARLNLPRESRAASVRCRRPAHGLDARVARPDAHRPSQKRRRHLRYRLERRSRLNHRHHVLTGRSTTPLGTTRLSRRSHQPTPVELFVDGGFSTI
jgi:hypothetical protein